MFNTDQRPLMGGEHPLGCAQSATPKVVYFGAAQSIGRLDQRDGLRMLRRKAE
ncbi:MAG: hypothetical protein H7Y15_05600 [Pseudonocardia sp.]|nr:hypothetical protein [Pseudonocardia sp.]